MPKKPLQLGNLPPLYNFFLNPYLIERFKHCPQCNGKTEQKKVPLVIHVDPDHPVSLNYTCRYCAHCDLLIAHQKEIDGYLAQMFMKSAPQAIGNDYLVIGTFDQGFWEQSTKTSTGAADLFENLHSFKQHFNFPRKHGKHFGQPTSKAPVQDSTSDVDDVEDAIKLVEAMKASLPITARPTKELLKLLRKQGYPMSDRLPLSIKAVFYGGDQSGITCDITSPDKNKLPVLCSLTHLEIIGDTPLADEMRAYQEKRKRKLAQLPDSTPGGFTIKRKP
jgi:hypothetical protein